MLARMLTVSVPRFVTARSSKASPVYSAIATALGSSPKATVTGASIPLPAVTSSALGWSPEFVTAAPCLYALAALCSPSAPALGALAGLEAAGAPLVVTTADHPLLAVEMVEHFIAAAAASGIDVAAGVALRPVVEQAGSTARRTYLRFRDGEVSGCNLFALMTPRASAALTYWRLLEAKRKHPLRMAWAVGPFTLIRYALGLLSTRAAAAALGRAAGCRAALIMLPFPDAAHDVDKPADLAFAEARLAARGDGS